MADIEMKPKMRTGVREAWSIALLAVFALLLLSLVSYDWRDISLLTAPPNDPPGNFIGPVGAWLSFVTFMIFGVASYLLPVWFLGFGVVLFSRGVEHARGKLVWATLMMFSLCCLIDLRPALVSGMASALNLSAPGGMPAQLTVHLLSVHLLGDVGALITVAAILAISSVLFFGWDAILREVNRFAGAVNTATNRLAARGEREAADWPKRQPAIQEWKRERIERVARDDKKTARRESEQDELVALTAAEAVTARATVPAKEPVREVPKPAPPVKPPSPKPKEKPVAEPVAPHPVQRAPVSLPAPATNYQLPPLSLLTDLPPAEQRAIQGDTDITARVIVQTLDEFGIKVQMKNIECGPVVTRYELIPAAGVKVEKISSLSNNLALSLKATSVRVQAPIPGKGTVGVEVPNASTTSVYLKEILQGSAWQPDRTEIPIVLGKDVGGRDLVTDLATMPHMLIAGATGSGKTVCMNSILAGLLMSRTPEQLQLMLIDPKIVEFSAYNNLPHLLGSRTQVITDPKKVAGGLRWAINEMERRYQLMAKVGVRNIKSFNARKIEKQPDLFGAAPEAASRIPDRLNYIVIIIDELADLMLTAQAEIEGYIARLAQMSRAVGIHMIIATQRPSVNVITGTIKANFPARIAFQVAQMNDSRTILDAKGAEKLLGRGDMLFMPPGASKLIRAQGAMTTDDDIRRIVDFIKKQCPPPVVEPAPAAGNGNGNVVSGRQPKAAEPFDSPTSTEAAAPVEKGGPSFDDMLVKGGGDDDADDSLLEMAIQIIRETHRASTSSLQRRLRIGYTRAARVMDVLEERGIVGPARGSDPREILIDLDGEVPNNGADPEERQEP
jgi:S-DNA-T family DNA segregation ATPase FtsK/SpoIIIE